MAERVVRNVENDYLMCSICLGRYTEPKLLPCGHTFCKQCLSDHITLTVTDRAASTFSCPNDRTQVNRPSPGLHPRQWAEKFPTDTFLKSLLQAVQVYEGSSTLDNRTNGDVGCHHDTDGFHQRQNGPVCAEHPDRAVEFFCLGCNLLVCANCAVRSHRSGHCECITIEEAVERMRPRIQALRRRFESQIHKINQINAGDLTTDGSLESSKARAQYALDELESRAGLFYQIVLQYIEDLRQQIREAGRGFMSENQQLNIVLNSIESTRHVFESLCNNNAGVEILNDLPKMEAQADEFDTATIAASTSSGNLRVDFVPQTAFTNFLRNPPPIGSIKISPSNEPRNFNFNVQNQFLSAATANASVGHQRSTQNSNQRLNQHQMQRQVSNQSVTVRPTQTPRPSRHSQRQQRNLTKINIKVPSENVTAWQLTGIAFVGSSVVAVDNMNNMLRQISLSGSLVMNQTLCLDNPLSVCNVNNPADVAVTQPELRQISIVTTEGGLRVKNVIKTHKAYEGIAHLPDGRLVVSCVTGRISIDVIEQGGRVLKSFERNHIFRWPRFLSLTTSGNILISDRDQKHLVSLSLNGQVDWTYSTPSSPWGVACDQNGKIFLCLDNNTVQILAENGDVIHEKFVASKDGIKTPYAICARPNQVAITEFGSSLFAPNSSLIYVATHGLG